MLNHSLDIRAIRAISFDADGTLFDFDRVMRRSLQVVLNELVCRYPQASRLSVNTMVAIRDGVSTELHALGRNLEDIRLEAFRRTLGQVGIRVDELAGKLNALYLHHRYSDIELFDDVLRALMTLRGRYPLAMVSNGNGHPERCGLPGYFELVVLAQNHGYFKPDPRLFQIAADGLGLSPDQILHVGDDLSDDVAGAQNAGMPAVWINRKPVRSATDVPPNLEVTSLAQLVALLTG